MHGVQHTATSGEVRRRPDGAIACFNALKLFFCMSFGAIFGCGLIGVESDQYGGCHHWRDWRTRNPLEHAQDPGLIHVLRDW
jgi:hypothetical protein